MKMGSLVTYDRACLHLTEEEVTRRIRSGQKFTVRLHVIRSTKLANCYLTRMNFIGLVCSGKTHT